jgi:hypothetical protein
LLSLQKPLDDPDFVGEAVFVLRKLCDQLAFIAAMFFGHDICDFIHLALVAFVQKFTYLVSLLEDLAFKWEIALIGL